MRTPASLSRPVTVPRILDRLVRLPAARAWVAVLLCADLAALGDLVTGPELWFGPFYLFVICLATWSLGWKAGQAAGIGCMALTFAVNGVVLYPYGAVDLAWNLVARVVAISVVVAVIAGIRRAYLREWWLARTDVLTGALNRQAFFDLGANLAAGTGWRVLLYADLDGLKAVNDGRGHAAGDACLKAYALAVRRIVRRADLFARVGGDEFLVFMAVRDETAARVVAARLHGAMNGTGKDGGLSCSVGALLVPPGAFAIDDLVRQADALMYRAKLRGGCLEVAVASASVAAVRSGRARTRPRAPAPACPLDDKPFGERRGTAASARAGL
jgi:diguanylate cyclase (GGDEF)-like protein